MKFIFSNLKNTLLISVLFSALSLSANAQTTYPDYDGDGYGNPAFPCYTGICDNNYNYYTNNSDCNDDDPDIHPWTWYQDIDGDGFYGATQENCYSPGSNWSKNPNYGPDCDDNNSAYHLRYWYLDVDADGYAMAEQWSCSPPATNWHFSGEILPNGKAYFRIGDNDCDDNDPNKTRSINVYVDADGDGYRGNTTAVSVCGNGVPSGYTSSLNNDVNDNNAAVWQSGSFMQDNDGDWYLVGPVTVQYGASVPAGYLPLNSNSRGVDCDDNNSQARVLVQCYVDADEDNFAKDNVIVYACGGDATYPVAPPGHVLLDDSFGIDCDDNNPNAFAVKTAWKDADGDGYVLNESIQVCSNNVPAGYTIYVNSTIWDCDDNNPNAQQIQTLYIDLDGDGYTTGSITGCGLAGVPTGYSSFSYGADCDDNNANIYRSGTFYIDVDNDGYPQNLTPTTICFGRFNPSGYLLALYNPTLQVDCDDNNPSVGGGSRFYVDNDNDGIGSSVGVTYCPYTTTPPQGYSFSYNDCDDNNAAIGSNPTWYIDLDNDGYYGGDIIYGGCSRPTGGKIISELASSSSVDCNDNNAVINPTNVWYQDFDNDGYSNGITFNGNPGCSLTGYKRADQLAALTGDCNDNNASFNPGAATAVWYQDADGDGYGNPSVSLTQCPAPAGYVATNTDCNDGNAQINPATIWYQDNDNDNVTSGNTLTQCNQPANYKLYSQLTAGTDCDDNNAGTGSACATGTSGGPYWIRDTDGDRWPDYPFSFQIDGVNTISAACAPSCNWVCVLCYNTSRSSLAPISSYDCLPNDPNSQYQVTLYADADNDGYTSGATTTSCNNVAVAGYKTAGQLYSGTDCNDNNASITINSVSGTVYYRDADGDGFGDADVSYKECSQPVGYVSNNTDCNDANAAINGNTIWYQDADNDGYSNGLTQTSCTQPSGFKSPSNLTATTGDCNDTLATINPTTIWYKDADGDGFSDGVTTASCDKPTGYNTASDLASLSGDCDDNDPALLIGITYYKDADNDLYSDGDSIVTCAKPTNYKLSAELLGTQGDCNDNDAAIHPGSLVGLTKWFADIDGDGFGDVATVQFSCVQPIGFVADSTDCNDGNTYAHPGAIWYKDLDKDGYSDGVTITNCARPNADYFAASELISLDTVAVPYTASEGVALDFNQTGSNYISIPDVNNSLDLNSEFTIEAWINPEDNANNAIVDKGDYKYLFQHSPNGTTGISFYRNGSWVHHAVTIPLNTWSHVAMTYSVNSNEIKFYFNGVQHGTTHVGAVSVTPDNGDVNIGRQQPASCQCNVFNGAMDEVRLWNTVRTPAEILANYNKELNTVTGLVGNYHFNQGVAGGDNTSFTNIVDASGYSNHGTLKNFTRNGASSNWIYPGAFTQYSSFAIGGDCNDTNKLEHPHIVWFKDADNDGYSDGTSIEQCAQPVGYKIALALVDTTGDCDDNNSMAMPNVLWAKDADGDGYTEGTFITQCLQPTDFRPYSELSRVDSIYTPYSSSVGVALNFDQAGSNYVKIPYNSSLDIQNEFTIEAWLNPADAANNTIIDKGDYTYLLSHNPNGTTGLGFFRNGTWVYNTMAIPTGTWSHIAITYSATANEIKFYLNGVPSGTTQSGAISITANNGDVNIGRQSPVSCQCNMFNGSMDEFRMWNKIRTANEIQDNYNKEIATAASGLVVNYHFNQGVASSDNTSFSNVSDASGNNNTGTLMNFTRNGATSNWVHPGGVVTYNLSIANLDCNDNNAALNPASVWYLDADADSLGNPLVDSVSCTMPVGYVLNNLDQNDAVVNAGAPNIIVKGNSLLIANQDTLPAYTDSTNFGSICNGSYDVVRTYTFENSGTADLKLFSTGVYGLSAGSYQLLDTVRVIPAAGSATIRVAFNSAIIGQQDAFFVIENDDAVDNVYLFKITANVLALPNVMANANDTVVCLGDSVLLNGSGAFTYAWDNSVTNGVKFVPSASNYFIVNGTDNNGCVNTDTLHITVNNLPIVTFASLSALCDNEPISSINGGVPANGFYSGTGVSSNNFDPSVGTQSITYTFTDGNGCISSAQQQQLVNPTYNVNTSVTICANESVFIGGANQNTAGSYTDNLFTTLGCDSVIVTQLTVNSPLDTTTIVNGATITANASTATYQWLNCDNGNAVIGGESSQAFTPIMDGNYAVVITQGNCSDTSMCINIMSTSIKKTKNLNNVGVYPNPNIGNFVVTSNETITSIIVFDMVGKVVTTVNPNSTMTAVSIKDQAEGVYFVKVISKNSQTIKRVIVTK